MYRLHERLENLREKDQADMKRVRHLNRNSALLALAATIGIQIPTSIERIQEPIVKVLCQLLAMLTVTYVAVKIDPRKGLSDPPPPPDSDPITQPDRKR